MPKKIRALLSFLDMAKRLIGELGSLEIISILGTLYLGPSSSELGRISSKAL